MQQQPTRLELLKQINREANHIITAMTYIKALCSTRLKVEQESLFLLLNSIDEIITKNNWITLDKAGELTSFMEYVLNIYQEPTQQEPTQQEQPQEVKNLKDVTPEELKQSLDVINQIIDMLSGK